MFALGGVVQVLLHLAPNLIGLGFAQYEYTHPHAFDKERLAITRLLQQGPRSQYRMHNHEVVRKLQQTSNRKIPNKVLR